MSFRRAARVDNNHNAIIKHFESLGWSVARVHQLKKFCDLVVAKNKITTILIEVKDGSKPPSQRKVSAGEKRFMESWKGDYRIVLSIDDVENINKEFS